MQYVSGRRINQDFGVPGITTNDTVVNVDGRIAVGIGTTARGVATANIDTNTLRIRDTVIDANGFSGELGYFLTKDNKGLTWVEVSPITSNSIFVADNGDILGVSSFTGLNIISDQLIGVTTNGINSSFADIRIDPRWFRDRTQGENGGLYTTRTVGIGLTQPRFGPVGILTDVKLDVLGDAIFTGVVSATSFTGEFNVDTKDLKVSGISSFTNIEDNILGIVTTGAVQIKGGVGIAKNVSIGQTLQVGSAVTIGNGAVIANTGDFVNLDVSGLSTFDGTARFESGVNIFDDLFVSGNIAVGGAGVTLDTETIRIEGKELLIGFTTAITPNDTTANSAGISIASTEGYSLVDLEVPGVNVTFNATITDRSATIATGTATTIGIATNLISPGQEVRGNFVSTGTTVVSIGSGVIGLSTETTNTVSGITALDFGTTTSTPNTYKQFKWFKDGTFVGQSTDAFISNQPISIGGTQIVNGQLFAVGNNINFTEEEITTKDLKVNRTALVGSAISMSGGIVTATTFDGEFFNVEDLNVTGIATIKTGIVTDLKVTGVSTFVGIATFGTVGIGTTNVIGSDKLTIIGDTRLGGVNDTLRVGSAISMSAGIVTATTFDGNFLSIGDLNVTGIATIKTGIITDLSVSGVSTFSGDVNIGAGETTAAFFDVSTGNVGIGTSTNLNDKLTIIGDVDIGGVNDTLSVGNSITMSNGIITATKLEGAGGGSSIDISGGTTIITGIVQIGESSIKLDGTNGTESIVIGSGITLSAVSVSTFANGVDINSDLDVSGISTLGIVEINSGVITATSGIVTYYGDGQYLENVITGVGIQSGGDVIGTGFTTLNFIGTGNTIVDVGNNTVNISINSSQFAGFAQTAGIATNLAGGVGGDIPYQSAADTTEFLSNGIAGQVLVSNGGTNPPQWANGASTGAIDGITIIDEVTTVGSSGSISILNFKGSAITATASGNISTITVTIPSIPDVNGSAGIASTARDVIGGIGSLSSLSVTGISTLGTVEINSGVITATSGIVTYYGDGRYLENVITENEISNQSVAFAQTAGIATEATRLQNSRDFSITGSFVTASAISFNGTDGVALAATITTNSIELGTYTTGDYVKSISGTANQITVTGGSGESSTPTISIPNNPTLPGNVTVENDLTVNGNLLIVGAGATLVVDEFKVSDKNIIAGFTTNSSGNDVSSDTTANGGGIAIASTVGNPLVDLSIIGIDTHPSTYKRLYWYQSGGGLGTDAWLSNYAFGIGTTQFPTGTYFAAGNVQITENDLAAVRNINSSGIITATTFSGNLPTTDLTGFITNAQLAGSITNVKLVNDSVSYGGVSVDLGASDATPAFDLRDATDYPYTSLTGITTEIVGDLTPQLGGNLDLNSKFITGTGGINVSGALTATSLNVTDKLISTGIGISVLNGAGNTATITGPANLIIDPAVVGDNTGIVRIKGDLYVDGTQTTINSTIVEIADKVIGIATTCTSDLLTDGAGIGIGSDKSFLYEFNSGTNPSLKSSENLNVPTGKGYQVNQVEVLNATTLGSSVLDSSLTTVGILSSLTSEGTIKFQTTASSPGQTAFLVQDGSATPTDVFRIYENGETVIRNTAYFGPTGSQSTISPNGSSIFLGDMSIRDGSTTNILLNNNGDATFKGDITIADKIIHDGDTDTAIRFPANDTFTVETAGSEKLRITSAGNVGIGSEIPSEKLDVNGTVKATDFNTTSDQNLKTNIHTIEDPLAKVVHIRGVNFEWKESNKPSAGVIAQEVEKVLPELINGEQTKTVNYNGLIGLLIEVVKEQQTQINSLNDRLSKLE